MNAERRNRPRFNPEGLSAHLIIEPTLTQDSIVIEGSIVDMSYSGIRLRLHQRLQQTFEEAHIRIVIDLPQSGVPLSIQGMIRHVHEQTDCGLQYADHQEQELDDCMFECIKSAPKIEADHALAID